MDYLKQNHLSIAIVVFLVISAFMGGAAEPLGALDTTTFGNPIKFTNTVTLGSSATALSKIYKGTCSLVSDASIAATSTGTGTCAATGVAAGDVVFVELATTTTKVAAQYAVVGTVAATDSITVRLLNLTGGAAVPSATNGFGSSTQYYVVR